MTPRVHLDTPDDSIPTTASRPPALKPDHTADLAHETRRQAAFESEFEWNGQPLHPFSISRESLFGQLRLAMGAPLLSRCLADTEGFAADAHRILFLCATPPELWNRLRADMPALQTAVDNWADQNITVSQKLLAETIAMKIWLASQENRHEPAPSANTHGDDLGN